MRSLNGGLRVFACALALGASACGAATAFAGKRSLPATSKSRIEINVLSAELTLVGWDKDELLIESKDGDAPEVRVNGDELSLQSGPPNDADLVIHYPAGARLDARSMSGDVAARGLKGVANVRSVSGSVRVEGAEGALRASSVSGDVHVKNARAGARLHSVSGSVTVDGVMGELRARSVSGSVIAKDANVASARLKSHSGEVVFQGSVAAAGSINVRNFSGNIELKLAIKDFRIRARSRTGDVRIQGLKADTEGEHRARGQVGAGGPEIELSNFSGNIRVGTP